MAGPHTEETAENYTGYGQVRATRSGQVIVGVEPLIVEYLEILPTALNYSIVGLLAFALSHCLYEFHVCEHEGYMAKVLGCGTGMQKVSAPHVPPGTMPLQSCPRLITDVTGAGVPICPSIRGLGHGLEEVSFLRLSGVWKKPLRPQPPKPSLTFSLPANPGLPNHLNPQINLQD